MDQIANKSIRMFTGSATSDDGALLKQIQETHAPDGREFDVKSIINIVEGMMCHATPNIDADRNGTFEYHEETFEDATALASFDGTGHETLATVIRQIACEITCKCSGEDVHVTTMSIFSKLSSYTWDAKMAITVAAFAMIYSEFWLVVQLSNTNLLAKPVALFRQVPSILENFESLKPRFDEVNSLIKSMLDTTRHVIEFKELRTNKYITVETPSIANTLGSVPMVVYWTLRSITTCTLQVTSLINMNHGDIGTIPELWDLSTLSHKIISLHVHLRKRIALCYEYIAERKETEAMNNVIQVFKTSHVDNMRAIRTIIYAKDDLQPLMVGSTKTTVRLEVLRKKNVLLLISNFDISLEVIVSLNRIYKNAKTEGGNQYEIVWLPIIDRSSWDEESERRFGKLQEIMTWYTVMCPIEPAVIKYIKDKWHFSGKPILVSLDQQGRVLSQNAFHMLWIWGNSAFPFSKEREEELWKSEIWSLELLIGSVDVTILDWVKEGKFVCLFGGEDIGWIREFATATKSMAEATRSSYELVYVGRSTNKDRVKKISNTIRVEKLSYFLKDFTSVWFFWERLESMLYSKNQLGKTAKNDKILQEVMTLLSYKSSEQAWAVFCTGTDLTGAKGSVALNTMLEYEKWEENAVSIGITQAIRQVIPQLGGGGGGSGHCNHLVLPIIGGDLPEGLDCVDCGCTMEKLIMYRCCSLAPSIPESNISLSSESNQRTENNSNSLKSNQRNENNSNLSESNQRNENKSNSSEFDQRNENNSNLLKSNQRDENNSNSSKSDQRNENSSSSSESEQ